MSRAIFFVIFLQESAIFNKKKNINISRYLIFKN